LLGLRGVADPSDELDADGTEDEVDSGYEVFERVEPNEDFECNGLELFANELVIGMAVRGSNRFFVIRFFLCLTEAL